MSRQKRDQGDPPGRSPRGKPMVRKVAYLYEDEADALEAESREKKCSEAEVIRRALRRYLDI